MNKYEHLFSVEFPNEYNQAPVYDLDTNPVLVIKTSYGTSGVYSLTDKTQMYEDYNNRFVSYYRYTAKKLKINKFQGTFTLDFDTTPSSIHVYDGYEMGGHTILHNWTRDEIQTYMNRVNTYTLGDRVSFKRRDKVFEGDISGINLFVDEADNYEIKIYLKIVYADEYGKLVDSGILEEEIIERESI